MSEETKEVPKQEEPAKEEKPRTSVDDANDVVEKLELANKKAEEILERQEALRAEQIISGKSEAGVQAENLSAEEKIKARANERLKDTGLQI